MFWHRPKSSKSISHIGQAGKDLGRPALLPRSRLNCFLLDLGALKLLCRNSEVEVLYSNESGSRRSTVNHFAEELRSLISESSSHKTEKLSFELLVLESALSTTVTKLYRQLELVEPLIDGLVEDTLSFPDEIKVGRLAALKKSIFVYNQGIQAIIKAIKELLSNDRDMADMYLSEKRGEDDHEEVEYLLEAYVTDLVEMEMKATGMIAYIEDTMQILELHLNSRRNRIIQLSLLMETLAVATASGGFIGSIFGMNLLHGWENHPTAFFWVAGGAGTVMVSLMVGLLLRFRHVVLASPKYAESQHSALKNFFAYIEDIEARVKLSDSISRNEFESIVNGVIGNRVDPKEIDIFFKVIFHFLALRGGVLQATGFVVIEKDLPQSKNFFLMWLKEELGTHWERIASGMYWDCIGDALGQLGDALGTH